MSTSYWLFTQPFVRYMDRLYEKEEWAHLPIPLDIKRFIAVFSIISSY